MRMLSGERIQTINSIVANGGRREGNNSLFGIRFFLPEYTLLKTFTGGKTYLQDPLMVGIPVLHRIQLEAIYGWSEFEHS